MAKSWDSYTSHCNDVVLMRKSAQQVVVAAVAELEKLNGGL